MLAVYLLTYYPITYKNVSVLCQSERACLHQTENIVNYKNNENTYPKGRAPMQMYRDFPQTLRGNCATTVPSMVDSLAITIFSKQHAQYNHINSLLKSVGVRQINCYVLNAYK